MKEDQTTHFGFEQVPYQENKARTVCFQRIKL